MPDKEYQFDYVVTVADVSCLKEVWNNCQQRFEGYLFMKTKKVTDQPTLKRSADLSQRSWGSISFLKNPVDKNCALM